MARYTGSVCRMCRREGAKLFLKGDKCYSQKCTFNVRPTPPGQHGQARQRKMSEYGIQLREKQKCRRAYGVQEVQFAHYYEKAANMRGVTGENRLGIGASRAQARQIVLHGHITVNGKRVNIPSFSVKAGDKVAVHEGSRDIEHFKALREGTGRTLPKWLTFDAENLTGSVDALPLREDVDLTINEQLIVEYYSR